MKTRLILEELDDIINKLKLRVIFLQTELETKELIIYKLKQHIKTL